MTDLQTQITKLLSSSNDLVADIEALVKEHRDHPFSIVLNNHLTSDEARLLAFFNAHSEDTISSNEGYINWCDQLNLTDYAMIKAISSLRDKGYLDYKKRKDLIIVTDFRP